MNIIGISSISYIIDEKVNLRLPYSYINIVKECDGIPLAIPILEEEKQIDKILNIISGLIIPGGGDINPKLYNEEILDVSKNIDEYLDEFQIKLVQKALDKDLPILGICRGHQILNVALSGSLYQDISLYKYNSSIIHNQIDYGFQESDKVHEVNFIKNSQLEKLYGNRHMTNSFHHQIIKKVGEGLEVIGYTDDGVIEAMISKNHSFVLSVQWHPERNADGIKLFKLFIDMCKVSDRHAI
ncbi:MAG TPA: gamma-glutamyl-gamma-aminobutyrate hydrolase family protein [Haloplasmataceae bacterium]